MSLSTMNGDGSLVRCLVERLTTRVRRRNHKGTSGNDIGGSCPDLWMRRMGEIDTHRERTLVLTSCSPQCSFRTGQAPPAKTSLKMTSFSSPVPPC